MIELDWVGGSKDASCELGHLCLWVERLAFDRRFVWTIDTLVDESPESVNNLAVGIADDLELAKFAAADAVSNMRASDRGSWIVRRDAVVIDMFPMRRASSIASG